MFFLRTFWFFRIHGGNVMDNVSQQYFAGNVDINTTKYRRRPSAYGNFEQNLFDVFVFMGRLRGDFVLVIAIILFFTQKERQGYRQDGRCPDDIQHQRICNLRSSGGAQSCVFIPFVVTPIAITVISYLAVSLGIVPYVTQTVEWTTPAILSGYGDRLRCGSLLQIVNIAVGVLIYQSVYQAVREKAGRQYEKGYSGIDGTPLRKRKKGNKPPWFLNHSGHLGSVAKMLVTDLRHAIKTHQLTLYYQPQVKSTGRVLRGGGAAALEA